MFHESNSNYFKIMARKKIKKEVRKKIWAKYGFRCAYCGENIAYQDMQIDHIIPHRNFTNIKKELNKKKKVIDYGIDSYKNLNPACRVCNHWKGVWSIEEFRHEIQMQTIRVPENTSGFRLALKYGLVKIHKRKKVKFFFETYKG